MLGDVLPVNTFTHDFCSLIPKVGDDVIYSYVLHNPWLNYAADRKVWLK
jgi:hypothetical protein